MAQWALLRTKQNPAHCLLSQRSLLMLYWAETEIHWRKDDDKIIVTETNIKHLTRSRPTSFLFVHFLQRHGSWGGGGGEYSVQKKKHGDIATGCRPSSPSSIYSDPSPHPLFVAMAGKKDLKEEITPSFLLGWAIEPNHIKFRTCSALAEMWTPLQTKVLN
jgi:hypothetical protein